MLRYLDLIELVTATKDFHVTDLRTVKALLDLDGIGPDAFTSEGSICTRITSFSITLSLPLELFQAAETTSPVSASQDVDSFSQPEVDGVATLLQLSHRIYLVNFRGSVSSMNG